MWEISVNYSRLLKFRHTLWYTSTVVAVNKKQGLSVAQPARISSCDFACTTSFPSSAFDVTVALSRSSLSWVPHTWMSGTNPLQAPTAWFWETYKWTISAALLAGGVSRTVGNVNAPLNARILRHSCIRWNLVGINSSELLTKKGTCFMTDAGVRTNMSFYNNSEIMTRGLLLSYLLLLCVLISPMQQSGESIVTVSLINELFHEWLSVKVKNKSLQSIIIRTIFKQILAIHNNSDNV